MKNTKKNLKNKVNDFLNFANEKFDIIAITLENKNQIPSYILGRSGDKDIVLNFKLKFMSYSFGSMETNYIYFREAGCNVWLNPEETIKSLGNDKIAIDKKLNDIWLKSTIAVDLYKIVENKIFLLMNYKNNRQRYNFYNSWKNNKKHQLDDMHGVLVFKK